MRYLMVLSMVLGLLVLASGGGYGVVSADHGKAVTVTGSVTGVDGTPATDAVVLISEDSTLTTFSPDELRTLASKNPPNLTVVETDASGRFTTTLDSRRAEAAVALSDHGISNLTYIRGENATLDLHLYERRPQIIHEHMGAVSVTERRADLFVNLVNSGDTTIENLSVRLVSLPSDWTVANVTTDGTYHAGTRTLSWSSVAPGGEIDTTVVLTVPNGTAVGTYTVELRADSATHIVTAAPETIEVHPEDTPTPPTMPSPTLTPSSVADAGEPPTTSPPSTPSPTEATTSSPTVSGPGFGVGAMIGALVLLTAVLLKRR